jgi:hypothetical protein
MDKKERKVRHEIIIDAYKRKTSKAVIYLEDTSAKKRGKSIKKLLKRHIVGGSYKRVGDGGKDRNNVSVMQNRLKPIDPSVWNTQDRRFKRNVISNIRVIKSRNSSRNFDNNKSQSITERSGFDKMLLPEKFTQVPKTQKDIEEFEKYQMKKIRLAKILETKIENETKILIKKQAKESTKVTNAAGINPDIKLFMFKQR